MIIIALKLAMLVYSGFHIARDIHEVPLIQAMFDRGGYPAFGRSYRRMVIIGNVFVVALMIAVILI